MIGDIEVQPNTFQCSTGKKRLEGVKNRSPTIINLKLSYSADKRDV
jgi:hypothetical protein